MSLTTSEINTQPDLWLRTSEVSRDALPANGRVAVVGCGTSWFMAQAYCAYREEATGEPSYAFTATEFPIDDGWDFVICLSRSGTTTEIIDVFKALKERGIANLLITAVGEGPAAEFADSEVVLDFADEESVVQTRFATTALVWLLSSLGFDVEKAASDCRKALELDLPESWTDIDQISFLGTGWTIGLANEAGLKCREAAQFWTETYPAMEYRHGPIAIAQPNRLTWVFGEVPTGLDAQVAKTGAELVTSALNPLAHLVVAQRLAVALAESKGLNPDTPRHLTRAVILEDGQH